MSVKHILKLHIKNVCVIILTSSTSVALVYEYSLLVCL